MTFFKCSEKSDYENYSMYIQQLYSFHSLAYLPTTLNKEPKCLNPQIPALTFVL